MSRSMDSAFLSCAGVTEADDINSKRILSDYDHVTARKSCSGDNLPTTVGIANSRRHCQQSMAVPTASGIANSQWHCQQPVALPTAGGIANSRWHCQQLLASQVTSRSI